MDNRDYASKLSAMSLEEVQKMRAKVLKEFNEAVQSLNNLSAIFQKEHQAKAQLLSTLDRFNFPSNSNSPSNIFNYEKSTQKSLLDRAEKAASFFEVVSFSEMNRENGPLNTLQKLTTLIASATHLLAALEHRELELLIASIQSFYNETQNPEPQTDQSNVIAKHLPKRYQKP